MAKGRDFPSRETEKEAWFPKSVPAANPKGLFQGIENQSRLIRSRYRWNVIDFRWFGFTTAAFGDATILLSDLPISFIFSPRNLSGPPSEEKIEHTEITPIYGILRQNSLPKRDENIRLETAMEYCKKIYYNLQRKKYFASWI